MNYDEAKNKNEKQNDKPKVTTSVIWEAEQQNQGCIIFYKEGAFWRAYERSAYLFCRTVRPYKPSKRYVKVLGQELASVGFPDQMWVALTPRVEFIEKTDDRIVLRAIIPEHTFEEFLYNVEYWKKDIDLLSARNGRKLAHESLPVYKSVYDLTLLVFNTGQHLQREYRHSLGERVKETSIDLLVTIYSAHMSDEKEYYIREARRQIEMMRVFMRILHDLGQINVKTVVNANLLIDQISQQLAAWHAKTKKRENAGNNNKNNDNNSNNK